MRATVYLSLLGPHGLKELGELCLRRSRYAAAALAERGLPLAFTGPTFKEFAVRCRGGSRAGDRAGRGGGLRHRPRTAEV